MADQAIFQQAGERLSAQNASGIFENFRTERGVEADDFEELAVAIAGHGRDAHASHHLAQALFQSEAVAGDTIGPQGDRLLEREAGKTPHAPAATSKATWCVSRTCPDSTITRNIPGSGVNQGFLGDGQCKQSRKGRMFGVDAAVGQQDQARFFCAVGSKSSRNRSSRARAARTPSKLEMQG